MTPDRLRELLDVFPSTAIAVVGDFFLDQYLEIDGALTEVSLETGLDAYQVTGRRLSPGAAGTVVNNLAALEVGRLVAVGFTGDDGEGYQLRKRLAALGVDMGSLLTRPDLFTPTYTKPMLRDATGAERELNRLDTKNREATPADLEDAILEQLTAVLPTVQAVIIADQIAERHLGVITDRVRDGIADLARAHPTVHLLADSRASIGLFREVMVKPNKFEAARAAGYEGSEEDLSAEDARMYGSRLAERNERPVFTTAGPAGVIVFDGASVTPVPGCPVPPPIDIVGAGDSTTAGIVAAFCAGASPVEAAVVGNCVASLTIQQLGTTGTATREQVKARFAENAARFAPL